MRTKPIPLRDIAAHAATGPLAEEGGATAVVAVPRKQPLPHTHLGTGLGHTLARGLQLAGRDAMDGWRRGCKGSLLIP